MIMNILFVCTGNTCRSPMAQALLQEKSTYHVKSAGLSAIKGIPTSEGAIKALATKGMSYKGSTQPITANLVEWSDLILTMTIQHKQRLVTKYPKALDKIYTLKEYVSDEQEDIWLSLKKAYIKLEEKRLTVINKHGIEASDQAWKDDLKKEQEEIERLEQKLVDYDILDPFGRDQQAYLETLAELDQAIAALIKKLDQQPDL
ncbi:low molecular weight protein arginine phosphatase [Amphibacillus sediminis]|uniref:low molecular weight protein arginine phosphatase n=1 Tax=Amphibacillus sediminis TaxID=360185 RepID=UPI001FE14C66|nr:low molecular weight protein arginine phosphatase [Amphibacillus sediminis]